MQQTTWNHPKSPETTQSHPKPPSAKSQKSPETIQKLPETIWNHPKLLAVNSKLFQFSRTSLQSLPSFSTADFEHELLVRKVKLGKGGENIAMIMN